MGLYADFMQNISNKADKISNKNFTNILKCLLCYYKNPINDNKNSNPIAHKAEEFQMHFDFIVKLSFNFLGLIVILISTYLVIFGFEDRAKIYSNIEIVYSIAGFLILIVFWLFYIFKSKRKNLSIELMYLIYIILADIYYISIFYNINKYEEDCLNYVRFLYFFLLNTFIFVILNVDFTIKKLFLLFCYKLILFFVFIFLSRNFNGNKASAAIASYNQNNITYINTTSPTNGETKSNFLIFYNEFAFLLFLFFVLFMYIYLRKDIKNRMLEVYLQQKNQSEYYQNLINLIDKSFLCFNITNLRISFNDAFINLLKKTGLDEYDINTNLNSFNKNEIKNLSNNNISFTHTNKSIYVKNQITNTNIISNFFLSDKLSHLNKGAAGNTNYDKENKIIKYPDPSITYNNNQLNKKFTKTYNNNFSLFRDSFIRDKDENTPMSNNNLNSYNNFVSWKTYTNPQLGLNVIEKMKAESQINIRENSNFELKSEIDKFNNKLFNEKISNSDIKISGIKNSNLFVKDINLMRSNSNRNQNNMQEKDNIKNVNSVKFTNTPQSFLLTQISRKNETIISQLHEKKKIVDSLVNNSINSNQNKNEKNTKNINFKASEDAVGNSNTNKFKDVKDYKKNRLSIIIANTKTIDKLAYNSIPNSYNNNSDNNLEVNDKEKRVINLNVISGNDESKINKNNSYFNSKNKIMTDECVFSHKFDFLLNEVFSCFIKEEQESPEKTTDLENTYAIQNQKENIPKVFLSDVVREFFNAKNIIENTPTFKSKGIFVSLPVIKSSIVLELFYRKLISPEGEIVEFYFNDFSEIRNRETRNFKKNLRELIYPKIIHEMKMGFNTFAFILQNLLNSKLKAFDNFLENFQKQKEKTREKLRENLTQKEKQTSKKQKDLNLSPKRIHQAYIHKASLKDVKTLQSLQEEKSNYRIEEVLKISIQINNYFNCLAEEIKNYSLKFNLFTSCYEFDFKPNYDSFDLHDTLNFCFEVLKCFIYLKGLSRTLEAKLYVDPNLPKQFFSDAKRIKEIILNLILNSIKYTRFGYIKISAEVYREKGLKEISSINNIKITVEDTGIGISNDKLKEIFKSEKNIILNNKSNEANIYFNDFIAKSFNMNNNNNIDKKNFLDEKSKGRKGIGLVLCREILQKIGREITCESYPYEITTFSFILDNKYIECSNKKYDILNNKIKKSLFDLYESNKNDQKFANNSLNGSDEVDLSRKRTIKRSGNNLDEIIQKTNTNQYLTKNKSHTNRFLDLPDKLLKNNTENLEILKLLSRRNFSPKYDDLNRNKKNNFLKKLEILNNLENKKNLKFNFTNNNLNLINDLKNFDDNSNMSSLDEFNLDEKSASFTICQSPKDICNNFNINIVNQNIEVIADGLRLNPFNLNNSTNYNNNNIFNLDSMRKNNLKNTNNVFNKSYVSPKLDVHIEIFKNFRIIKEFFMILNTLKELENHTLTSNRGNAKQIKEKQVIFIIETDSNRRDFFREKINSAGLGENSNYNRDLIFLNSSFELLMLHFYMSEKIISFNTLAVIYTREYEESFLNAYEIYEIFFNNFFNNNKHENSENEINININNIKSRTFKFLIMTDNPELLNSPKNKNEHNLLYYIKKKKSNNQQKHDTTVKEVAYLEDSESINVENLVMLINKLNNN